MIKHTVQFRRIQDRRRRSCFNLIDAREASEGCRERRQPWREHLNRILPIYSSLLSSCYSVPAAYKQLLSVPLFVTLLHFTAHIPFHLYSKFYQNGSVTLTAQSSPPQMCVGINYFAMGTWAVLASLDLARPSLVSSFYLDRPYPCAESSYSYKIGHHWIRN